MLVIYELKHEISIKSCNINIISINQSTNWQLSKYCTNKLSPSTQSQLIVRFTVSNKKSADRNLQSDKKEIMIKMELQYVQYIAQCACYYSGMHKFFCCTFIEVSLRR